MPDATMRGLAEEEYGRIDWLAVSITRCSHKSVYWYVLRGGVYCPALREPCEVDLEDVGAGYWMAYWPQLSRLFVKLPEVRA